MIITSVNNKMVLYANSLKNKKYRDSENKYLIEGEHLILMENEIECIFTTNKDYKNENCVVYYVNDEVMKKLSFVQSPQGIIGIVRKKNYEIDYHKQRYLICDGVSDPGNMGTIIRTALAFHIDMIILSYGSVDIYNEKVIRSSQGAILKMPIVYANLSQVYPHFKENGIKIYASTLSNDSVDLTSIEKVDKFALVVGNEGSGISDISFKQSDVRIKIAHSNCIDSLNVGVATSIMLYHFDSLE